MLDRITFDPLMMGGKACIRGMRIPVSLVANGMTTPEILEEDIRQALLYVASHIS